MKTGQDVNNFVRSVHNLKGFTTIQRILRLVPQKNGFCVKVQIDYLI